MTFIDWAVIALYLGSIIAMGRYFARRQHNTDDYFLGGGRIPWMAVALSVVASLASTVGYLGAPGEIIKYGPGILVSALAIPLAIPVIILIIVPFYKRAGVTTAFELLAKRYGPSTRGLGVIIWGYMQIAFMGLVLLLASNLIADIIGIWNVWVIIVIGIASVMYTSAGGMSSVVWTDVVQFFILFAGAVVTVGVVAAQTGTGVGDWWQEISSQTHELPAWFDFDPATRHTVFGTLLFGFIVNVSYASSEQVIVQRYGATRNAITMMLANYGAGILFTLLEYAVGAALLVYYLKMPETLPEGVTAATQEGFTDKAFPNFIVHCLPVGLTGLVLAALLGAAQSTLDSGINSMSAVFSKDVLPLLGHKEKKGRELKNARWSTRVVGVGVVLMALAANNLSGTENIVGIAQKVVHLGLGPMGALFLVTMIECRIGTVTANISLLAGLFAAAVFAFHEQIVGVSLLSPILIIPVSFMITMLLSLILGPLLPAPTSQQSGNKGKQGKR